MKTDSKKWRRTVPYSNQDRQDVAETSKNGEYWTGAEEKRQFQKLVCDIHALYFVNIDKI